MEDSCKVDCCGVSFFVNRATFRNKIHLAPFYGHLVNVDGFVFGNESPGIESREYVVCHEEGVNLCCKRVNRIDCRCPVNDFYILEYQGGEGLQVDFLKTDVGIESACNLLDGNGSQTGLDLRHLQQKSHRNDYCDYTDHRQP